MNSTSHLEQVVLNQNGEVYNPMDMDIESAIRKGIFCSIGIPLNGSVAVLIAMGLRNKPRNYFLLAIILSYFSFFIPPLIELINWGLYEDESLCQLYFAADSIPQVLLLTNMLLALVERYLAINHTLLHKRKMTPKFAWCLIVFSSILTVFLQKFVYIVQLGSLSCEIWYLYMKITAIVLIILFTSCMTMDIIVYRLTNIFLSELRTLNAPPDNRHLSSSNPFSNATPMSVHVGRRQLSQMGMEATRTLVYGVASICISHCIVLVYMAAYFTCQFTHGQVECSYFIEMRHLVKDLMLIPAIYSPIIFLVRNKEL